MEVGWGGPPPDDVRTVFDDSADIVHEVPLYERVKNSIQHWRNIGTNNVVLDWIENGVYIKPDSSIPNFFQKQIEHTADQLDYWRNKLKPHYISSGAIV